MSDCLRKEYNAAFTLVEMSMVLVVIGLIITGITAGMSLVDGSKVQAVIFQVKDYKTQVEIFEDKYAGLPGDLPNAEDHWPDARYSTDNGNGNGLIESVSLEDFMAWEQLYLAGLVPFAYSGNGVNYAVDNNIPDSNFKNAGYRLVSNDGAAIYEASVSTRLRLDFATPNGANFNNSVLSPKMSESIDLKIDNGLPTTGEVVSLDGNDAINNCVNTTPTPNKYQVNSKEKECYMVFWYEKQ